MKEMSDSRKSEITKIAQEFASGFNDTVGKIAGSGWLIVDPLSGYLNFLGYTNEIMQLPANEKHPLILIIRFKDGTQFIPAGSDLQHPDAKDWMWL